MTLYLIIAGAILAAVVVLWLLIWSFRRFLRRRRNSSASASALRRRREVTPKRLRAWVEENASDSDLEMWFASLSKRDLQNVINDLKQFAETYQFDLAWLTDDAARLDPQLQSQLRDAIIQRLQSRLVAAQSLSRIQLFSRYQALLRNPGSSDNQTLAQNLYTELVTQGLAPTTPPNLILARETKRQKYSMERIEEVAERDWDAFSTVFQNVLAGRLTPIDEDAASANFTATAPAPAAV